MNHRRNASASLQVLSVLVALLMTQSASAANVNLTGDNAFGESWTTGADWSDGNPAQSGNAYHVGNAAGKTLRTPNDVTDPTFPGDSLTIHGTGTMGMKHYGTATIADLRLDGGQISHWVGNRTMTIGGNLTVVSASTFSASGTDRTTGLSSTVTGAANLAITGTGVFRLTGDTSGYSGNWTVQNTYTGLEIDDNTMNVTGGLDIDRLRVGYDTGTGVLDVLDGAVAIGTGTQTVDISRRENVEGATTGTADFTSATSVTLNLAELRVGTMTGGTSSSSKGVLDLSTSGTNAITADSFVVGDSPNSGNTAQTSEVNFGGGTNTVDADTVTIAGRKSNATVTIGSGGTLTLTGKSGAAADLNIGHNNAGTGSNIVGTLDMTGGTFNATLGQVILGLHNSGNGSGKGTLTMDAGTVTAANITLADPDASGSSTTDANTTGTINLNGGSLSVTGSVSDGGGTSTINVNGTASLAVGGIMSVDTVNVGRDNGNTGSLAVAANFILTGTELNVGRDGGDGTLDVDGTFDVSIGTLNIGRRTGSTNSTVGTLDLGGSSASASITTTNTYIGVASSDTPHQPAQGTLILGSGTNNVVEAGNELRIGDSPGAGQTGSPSRVELNGTTTIDTPLMYVGRRKSVATMEFGTSGGTLNLQRLGGRMPDLRIGYNDTNTGTHATGHLDGTGGTINAMVTNLVLGQRTRGSSSGSGAGTLTLDGGTFDVTTVTMGLLSGSGNGTATGTINLNGGTLIAGTILNGGGTANFNFDGGTLQVDNFNFNLVQDGGILAPGTSPGTTTVSGAYTLNDGTVQIEIDWDGTGTPTAGTHFDQLIADTVDLNGGGTGTTTLDIDLLGGTAANLEAGDSFPIITFNAGNGGNADPFTSEDLPALGGNLAFDVQYDFAGGNVTLTVVPEPSAALLAAIGLTGLLSFGRRRRR